MPYSNKQTVGDNTGKKPGMFDMKKLYKWRSWKDKNGMTVEDAMEKYIGHVEMLLGKFKQQ